MSGAAYGGTAVPAPAGQPAPMTSGSSNPDLKRGTLIGVLLGLMLGMLMGALDNTIVLTAGAQIVRDLGQPTGLEFVVAAYLVAQTVAMPIFGKLSDQFGRRAFFLLGLALFMVGSLLSGASQNFQELLGFRAIQGVGSGAFFPVANSIIGVLFAPKERARLSGLLSSVFGIAVIGGPFLGSVIVDSIGWRWIFYVNLPIGIVSFIAVSLTLGPLRSAERRETFDWLGAGLLSAWVGVLVFTLSQVTYGWSWTAPVTVGLLGSSVASFVAFLVWEARATEPIVPLRLFRSRVVAASNAVSFLRGVVMLGGLTFVTVVVTSGLGGSTDTSRDVLYGLLGPMIVGSMVGGQLLPRVGYRPLVASGLAAMTFGALLLLTISGTSAPYGWSTVSFGVGSSHLDFPILTGIVVLLIPVGVGIGLTFAPVILAVQYGVPPRDIGVGSSLVQFMGNLGGSIGLALLGSFQAYQMSHLGPPGPAPCPNLPPANKPDLACVGNHLPYYQSLSSAFFASFHDVFVIVLVVSAASFVVGLWVVGRLPSAAPRTARAVDESRVEGADPPSVGPA